jgi:hypothetical protein
LLFVCVATEPQLSAPNQPYARDRTLSQESSARGNISQSALEATNGRNKAKGG